MEMDVTDNGPCYRYKAGAFARYIRSRPEFEHVRTRYRSPETNGVIERWYQSLKYEHLYLQEIDDGPALAEHVLDYARIYNRVPGRDRLDLAALLAAPEPFLPQPCVLVLAQLSAIDQR